MKNRIYPDLQHMKLNFKPLAIKDLKLLHQWFQEPTIHKMYGRNQTWSITAIEHKYKPRIMGQEFIPSFIITDNQHSIGFIQYYCLKEHLPEGIQDQHNPLFDKYPAEQIAGIDLFIANHAERNKGLGTQIIQQCIETFLTNYACIVVDPEKNNQPAIRCYTKCGFMETHFSTNTEHMVLIKELSR